MQSIVKNIKRVFSNTSLSINDINSLKKSYSAVSQYFSNDFTTLANLSAFSKR